MGKLIIVANSPKTTFSSQEKHSFSIIYNSLHIFLSARSFVLQNQFVRKMVSYNSLKLIKNFGPIRRFGVLIFSNWYNKDYFLRKINQKMFYRYSFSTKKYWAPALCTWISANLFKNTMLNCEEFIFTLQSNIFLWGNFHSILVTCAEHFF